MKQKTKIFFILFSLLLPGFAFSQRAVVGLSKMNVLYIGVDNPVDIAISGIPDDRIVVAIEGGTITGEKGKYFVRPINSPANRFIKLFINYQKNKDQTFPIDTFVFRVKQIPYPKLFLGSKTGVSVISKAELKLQSMLSAQMENFTFSGLRYEIKSYTFNFITENKFESISDTSAFLSGRIRSYLNDIQPNSKIIIDSITATANWNNNIISLPRVELFVEDPNGPYISFSSPGTTGVKTYYYNKQIYYKIQDSVSKNSKDQIKKYLRITDTSTRLLRAKTFNNNKLYEEKEYYKNGEVYFQINYQQPEYIIGNYKKYFPNGKTNSEGKVKKDTIFIQIIYREESEFLDSFLGLQMLNRKEYGQKLDSTFGDFDFNIIRTGSWKFYYQNGRLKSAGDYTNEVIEISQGSYFRKIFQNIVTRHGKWNFYKENGKLEKEIIYDKGKVVSEKKY